EVCEHTDAGPAVEHDFLAPVARERPRLECHGTERVAFRREAADQISHLGSKRLLPLLGLRARAGLKPQAARRGAVSIARVGHGIESAIVKAVRDPGEGTDVTGC